MSEQSKRPSLFRWLMTPPQAYVTYLAAVLLIGTVSFYAGTLRPNKHPGLVPAPATSAPVSK